MNRSHETTSPRAGREPDASVRRPGGGVPGNEGGHEALMRRFHLDIALCREAERRKSARGSC